VSKKTVWNIELYIKTFTSRATLQPQIFNKLKDSNWHCRDVRVKVLILSNTLGVEEYKGAKGN